MNDRAKKYLTLSLIGATLLFTCWWVNERYKPLCLHVRVEKVAYSQQVPR